MMIATRAYIAMVIGSLYVMLSARHANSLILIGLRNFLHLRNTKTLKEEVIP
jgi:hypothetical protein